MADEAMAATAAQGGINIITALNLSSAALTYTDPDGFSNFTTSADLNLRTFGLSGTFTTTLDVGATSSNQGSIAVGVQLPASLTLSFTTAWPSSASPAGLGVGVLDLCATPGSGICSPGSSGDYPLLMAPASGVSMTLTSNAAVLNLMLGSSTSHTAMLSDAGSSSLAISGSATGVNLALVDPGSVTAVGSMVGGAGFHSLAMGGLEFGSGSNATSLDFCTAAVTSNCPLAKTNPGGSSGVAGLLLNFGSSAMTSVSFVASGVAIGNVGSGASYGGTGTAVNNNVGTVALGNLNIANTAVLISGH